MGYAQFMNLETISPGIGSGIRSSKRDFRPTCFRPRRPRPVNQFCRRFNAMGVPDKPACWAYFFQAVRVARERVTVAIRTVI